MLDGAVVVLGLVEIARLDWKVPGGGENWPIGEHGLVGELLGSGDGGMVEANSKDLREIVSIESLSFESRALIWHMKEVPARTTAMIGPRMLKIFLGWNIVFD